jgi:para-nitrobenzyl esterase
MTDDPSTHHRDEPARAATLDRRSFLGRVLAAGASAAPAMLSGRLHAQSQATDVVARTAHGRVRGARKDGVLVFKGIPYAGSPAGANRFKPAPPLKPWGGVRDALLYGPQSIQPPDPNWPKEWKPAISTEECLFLNVWTQDTGDRRKRPVMFYSHGGGFATGNGGADVSPQDTMHDGAALARDYDVVVVTHNHRLGIMGYLYLGDLLGEEYAASGVAGMTDIAAALQWVHENIAEFGGDPDRIMIWGESGGGAKTSAITAMPSAKGMFHRASIESGSTLRLRTRDSASATAEAVLAALGLTRGQAREVLKVPAEKLRHVQQSLPRTQSASPSATSTPAVSLGFSPMVDGHVIPAHPYDPVATPISAEIPIIVGINKDETLFMYRSNPEVLSLDAEGLRKRLEPTLQGNTDRVLEIYRRNRPSATPAQLYIAITTAQWMGANAITLAERKAALTAGPVFMYVFAYEQEASKPGALTGAAHASEIPFKFNHVEGDPSSGRVRAAKHMSRAWATFARTGNPSHEGIPRWPAYTLDQRATMFLDAECTVVNDPNREERLLWQRIAQTM